MHESPESLESPDAPDAPDAPLDVLWRDAHLIAIHKPAGWLVHRTGLDAGETRFVVQTLRAQLGGQHVHPVHRLDKGTCGVLLLALHAQAARAMSELIAGRALHKRYLALVRGWAPDAVQVDHALRPDDAPPDAPVQDALTRFRCLARFERDEAFDARHAATRSALVEALPVTGRRHQIRRHLKHLAHPILGDATHGKGLLNRWWAARLGLQRLWLHAQSLAFTHPLTGEPVEIDSGLHWRGDRFVASSPARAKALVDWLALPGALGALGPPGPPRRVDETRPADCAGSPP